jgi:hypothetical protein
MQCGAYHDICSPILYGLDSHVRPSRSSHSCGLAAHDWELRRWTTAVNVELLAAPRQSRGAAVRLYLETGGDCARKSAAAVDETTRNFHQAMESKWMDLAASTAFVERADLFMRIRELRPRLSPCDLSSDCNKQMLLKAIHTTLALEEHIFRCRNCGSEHTDSFAPDGRSVQQPHSLAC